MTKPKRKIIQVDIVDNDRSDYVLIIVSYEWVKPKHKKPKKQA